MTQQGCDYGWERPNPAALARAGYKFAVRYLSRDTTGKNLTAAEAQALHAAGLSIVLNWEYAPGAARGGFAQGAADAVDARTLLTSIGAPVDSVVYFSVDFDAQPADFPAISDYFRGCAAVLGAGRVGVYGGYAVVALLTPSPYVLWFWQTYAWSGGRWHAAAHIRQTANEVPFGSVRIDNDTAMKDHYGQWPDLGGSVMDDYGNYGTPQAIGDRTVPVMVADLWGQEMNDAGPYQDGGQSQRSQMLAAMASQVASNGAALSAIVARLDAIEARLTGAPAAAGTVHVTGDLTVG